METLNKFSKLTFERQLRLLEAAFWHLGLRIGLKILPFAVLRGFLARGVPAKTAAVDEAMVRDVLRDSKVISRRLPGAGCLADAMATQMLLARRGHTTRLRVGVRRIGDGELGAHAWLERHGETVIGGVDSPRQFESVPLSSIS